MEAIYLWPNTHGRIARHHACAPIDSEPREINFTPMTPEKSQKYSRWSGQSRTITIRGTHNARVIYGSDRVVRDAKAQGTCALLSFSFNFVFVRYSSVDMVPIKSAWPKGPTFHYRFELVPGFFLQELDGTEPTGLPDRFGLIDASPQRWESFQDQVKTLQLEENAHDSSYKVFFVGRHGQGWHNLAESKYGVPAWNSYWSLLNTDGEIVWGPDAKLTPLGESQAEAVNTLWESELLHGVPLPESFYSSPLSRAAQTAKIAFSNISHVDQPLIVEYVREVNGQHTCDKRSTRTQIQGMFPEFEIESGFTEEDELWTAVRETDDHVLERVRNVMDRIFTSDPSTYISITAHGGWITQLLNLVGHRAYNLPTGGVIPIVVKATLQQA